MRKVTILREKALALRTALDDLLRELDEPAPGKRRNLKEKRIEKHEENYALRTWRKPIGARKKK